MGGKTRRPEATEERRLHPESVLFGLHRAPVGGLHFLASGRTLEGGVRLKVSIGRCENRVCARYHCPMHPLAEGHLVVPLSA